MTNVPRVPQPVGRTRPPPKGRTVQPLPRLGARTDDSSSLQAEDSSGMRVLVCGSRNWPDPQMVGEIIKKLPTDTVVIAGGAQGADMAAAAFAKLYLDRAPEVYPADWKTYGRRAGPIRNQVMLDLGKPHFVIFFCENIHNPTPGTADMIRRSKKAGLPVIPYTECLEPTWDPNNVSPSNAA